MAFAPLNGELTLVGPSVVVGGFSSGSFGRPIELHIHAVLDLTATAASLYMLGSRAKAESAHVAAELCYSRLLIRLSGCDAGETAWWQSKLDLVHEAFALLTVSKHGTDQESTVPSPPDPSALFLSAGKS
jgi:hypothetical protein